MIKKNMAEVEALEIKKDGFKGMFARYLWSTDDGDQKFAMRIMEFEPYGYTSYHSHLEEHQFLFLEGEPLYVDGEGRETRLKPGDTVYCAPDEPHQIKNAGNSVMKMVCMIPILPGGDGKFPAPRPPAGSCAKTCQKAGF